MKNTDVFYKKDGKYFPIKKKSFAELNAIKKKKKDDLGEIKFHIVVVNDTLSSTPVITPLTNFGTGATADKRIGNVIKSYSLQIKGFFTQNLAAEEFLLSRVVIFIDWQNQGVLPLITDLFLDAVEYNRNMIRLSNSSKYVRYTFLMDKLFIKETNGVDLAGTGMIQYIREFDFYHQIKHKIYYEGPNGLIAEVRKGNVFIITSDFSGDNLFRFKSVFKYTEG